MQARIPRIISTAKLGVIPAGGVGAVEVVGVAIREIVVPDRSVLQFAAAVFPKILAQPVAVDLLGDFVEPLVVNKAVAVDVSLVAGGWIGETRTVEHCLERVEIVCEIGLLRRVPGVRYVSPDLHAIRGGVEDGVAGAKAVMLHNVTASDGRRIGRERIELGHIHSVGAPFDFFYEDIDAVVGIGVGQRLAGGLVKKDFAKLCPHAEAVATAEQPGARIGEEVAQERLVVGRRVNNPGRTRRQAEDG